MNRRAKVTAVDGNRLTYEWPCGHTRVEVLTFRRGGRKVPVHPTTAAILARTWADGVTYPCPKCKGAGQ